MSTSNKISQKVGDLTKERDGASAKAQKSGGSKTNEMSSGDASNIGGNRPWPATSVAVPWADGEGRMRASGKREGEGERKEQGEQGAGDPAPPLARSLAMVPKAARRPLISLASPDDCKQNPAPDLKAGRLLH
ncbi:hypothetical protein BY996DRAFT_6620506 [Phakopsora pachyrhizi]|nr:hypothetical protein BY996DRAFT_6620506 [Phakopsora pachyrhizi]